MTNETQGADGAGTSRDSFPERRGDWMQTFTGRRFWPLDPRPEDVCIEDIAHALALQTRFGGHCLRFYSVAEHCVHLARATPPEHALWALLHDASEAYIADIVRPLKRHLDGYGAAEIKVMGCVCETFDLDGFMPEGVKALDNRILMDERAQVMLSTGEAWHYGRATEPLGVTLQFWTPEQAEREFLTTFAALTGRQVALPALASPRADSAERTANVAQALRSADWGGVSIGNKALIAAAISELEATPAPSSPGVPDSVRALSEAATQGAWVFERMHDDFVGVYSDDRTGSVIANFAGFHAAPRPKAEQDANARFAAEAVNHVRALISAHPAGQSTGQGAEKRTIKVPSPFIVDTPAPDSTRTGQVETEEARRGEVDRIISMLRRLADSRMIVRSEDQDVVLGAADVLDEYQSEAVAIVECRGLRWSAWSEDDADSIATDPLVGYSTCWYVGVHAAEEPDPFFRIMIGSGKPSELMARKVAAALNDGAPCPALAARPAAPEAQGAWIKTPERFVIAVKEFLADWRKGDFSLPKLAELDAESIEAALEDWASRLPAPPASSGQESA